MCFNNIFVTFVSSSPLFFAVNWMIIW